jgi:hypothetical protein
VVQLIGSGSTDENSSPGTNDDIVLFEWFEDFGAPFERRLGTGDALNVALALGAHTITLRVTDSQGATDMASTVVTVRDTTPPALSLAADATVLWPPNHRLVPVAVGWRASDVCDPAPSVRLMGATSSEPDDAPGTGDGATTGDIGGAEVGGSDGEVLLRAERDGAGSGRTYELVYAATDASGNSVSSLVTVTVPHDLGQGPEPLRMRAEPGAAAGSVRLYWAPVAGAESYDVIAGAVEDLRLEDGRVRLGAVGWAGRGVSGTAWQETEAAAPPVGKAVFYLMQWHAAERASGFGTESVPWPREPDVPDATAGGDQERRTR